MESIKQIKSEEVLRKEASVIFNELIKRPEISEALDLLDRLPESLKYHNKAHTLDVLMETILFALADGASEEVIFEQAVSAAWHDVGFIVQINENEAVAIEMFKQSRAYQTLSEEQRANIIANISDTQLKMKDGQPFLLQQNSKFGYILDGDVSNFGREDYFEKRMLVAQELGLDLSNPKVKKRFFKLALDLLKNHEWKTASAKALRQVQKEINIRGATEEYEKLENTGLN